MFSQANSNHVIAAVPNGGEDNPVWSQTSLASFVISSETTQGKAAVMETVPRKGQEPPRHCHLETDEEYSRANGTPPITKMSCGGPPRYFPLRGRPKG